MPGLFDIASEGDVRQMREISRPHFILLSLGIFSADHLAD